MNRLETKQLTLSYHKTPIINDLYLALPSQQVTALVGPNGCGKSTLLRGLARLLKPRRGTVYLDGAEILKLSTKAVAKRLGILPQSPIAPEGLTVRDLVAQGRYPYQNWLQQWSKQDEEMVAWALDLSGMTEFADRALDNLSGGQRQRAWIAMALAQNTEILLLDEPTTFLDLAHQIDILELLSELNETQDRTIVMVVHDLNQAARYADNMVVIQQGQIYDQGRPKQVMTEAMVSNVFGVDSRIVPDPVVGTPMCVPLGRQTQSKSS
ncbi:MAG: ABC transporter ATP-binding protein [Halothece sp.]